MVGTVTNVGEKNIDCLLAEVSSTLIRSLLIIILSKIFRLHRQNFDSKMRQIVNWKIFGL